MARSGNNGNGDHGRAARASLQERPSTSIRLPAAEKALVCVLAAMEGKSFNACIGEAVELWLRVQAARLNERLPT